MDYNDTGNGEIEAELLHYLDLHQIFVNIGGCVLALGRRKCGHHHRDGLHNKIARDHHGL